MNQNNELTEKLKELLAGLIEANERLAKLEIKHDKQEISA